nr:unnamed protein product [Timema tahoe]
MKDAMTFWLDRGVAGFRVDAVPFLFEVTSLQDEPLSNDPKALPDDYLYLIHNYTVNLEETFDMVQQWRGLIEARQEPKRLMMAEAYADFETTLRYYGTPQSPGAHFPFNFAHITDVNGNSTPADFLKATKKWIDDLPPGALSNWVIGNHDNHRVASRFGRELVDGLNMLALLLPGVAVTYNGEEIGMEDTSVSWEQTKDPQALDAGPERYLQYTRDPERTPFQWDDTTSAGFSNSEVTWLPVNSNYPELNVEAQKKASVSHYHVYKLLTAARATPTIQRGDTQVEVIGDHVFAFTRSVKLRRLQDSDTYVILMNLGAEEEIVDLLATFSPLADKVMVYAASVHSGVAHGLVYGERDALDRATTETGDITIEGSVRLYACIVYKYDSTFCGGRMVLCVILVLD